MRGLSSRRTSVLVSSGEEAVKTNSCGRGFEDLGDCDENVGCNGSALKAAGGLRRLLNHLQESATESIHSPANFASEEDEVVRGCLACLIVLEQKDELDSTAQNCFNVCLTFEERTIT
jgi:hypothetical protein